MAVDSGEFMAVAKLLAASGDSEIYTRNAISRAYYAALHTLNDTLPETGTAKAQPGESTHQRIIGRALDYGSKSPRLPGGSYAAELARLLTKFRRMRNAADYDLEMDLPLTERERGISMAERAAHLCDDLKRLRMAAALTLPARLSVAEQPPEG